MVTGPFQSAAEGDLPVGGETRARVGRPSSAILATEALLAPLDEAVDVRAEGRISGADLLKQAQASSTRRGTRSPADQPSEGRPTRPGPPRSGTPPRELALRGCSAVGRHGASLLKRLSTKASEQLEIRVKAGRADASVDGSRTTRSTVSATRARKRPRSVPTPRQRATQARKPQDRRSRPRPAPTSVARSPSPFFASSSEPDPDLRPLRRPEPAQVVLEPRDPVVREALIFEAALLLVMASQAPRSRLPGCAYSSAKRGSSGRPARPSGEITAELVPGGEAASPAR
jgi:hypothetical protein